MKQELDVPGNGEKHEHMSGLIVDRIYTNNQATFNKNGLTQNHIGIIKSFITGIVCNFSGLNEMHWFFLLQIPEQPPLSELVKDKEFLYEVCIFQNEFHVYKNITYMFQIVANKFN